MDCARSPRVRSSSLNTLRLIWALVITRAQDQQIYEIVGPHLTKNLEAACGTALVFAKVALWSREVVARFVDPAL